MWCIIMYNLWKVLEEEKKKNPDDVKREEREKTIKKQYTEVNMEFDEVCTIVKANYMFYCFLLDIFPNYIKTLIKNNHNALLNGKSVKGKISFVLEDDVKFLRNLARKCCLSDEMIYSIEDDELEKENFEEDELIEDGVIENKLTLKFNDNFFYNKFFYNFFIEKLNLLLIKNNIIFVNRYANPICFEAKIEDLIKAYEDGIKQIVDEKENLKILMDTWNIKEDNIMQNLHITPKYYQDLMNSAKRNMQLNRKK